MHDWPQWPVWDEREAAALLRVLESGEWGGYSSEVSAFERAFASRQASRACVATMNGTVSLVAALAAFGIGPGDEVVVPPYTFFATASSVVLLGATPVFADIDPDTYNLSPSAVEAALSERTRAVIAVHFGGHAADLDALTSLTSAHDLVLIEDAAHAHGTTWHGRPVGALGHAGSFSFQSNKNVTAGEGGAAVTDDEDTAERIRSYVNQGRTTEGSWYDHPFIGSNLRMTAWQAAILDVQLTRLDEQLARRAATAGLLRADLERFDGLRPLAWDERCDSHAHHLFVLRYDPSEFGGLSRDRFAAELRDRGIPCSTGYEAPLYRQGALAPPVSRLTPCPVAEQACVEAIWLSHNLLLADPSHLSSLSETVEEIRTRRDAPLAGRSRTQRRRVA